jgi:hypothetical protein
MKNQIFQFILIIISTSILFGCNSENDKIRYEIISSTPIDLEITYDDGERNDVKTKFNGNQWSYEGEMSFINGKVGHDFLLQFDGKCTSQHTVTAKIYRGPKILVEKTFQSREPMNHDPTTFRSSGSINSYIEP